LTVLGEIRRRRVQRSAVEEFHENRHTVGRYWIYVPLSTPIVLPVTVKFGTRDVRGWGGVEGRGNYISPSAVKPYDTRKVKNAVLQPVC